MKERGLRSSCGPSCRDSPPAVREARELVRYRARLVQLRSGLKAQVHAVMAKEGVLPDTSDMFGPKGQCLLDAMELGDVYLVRVEPLRDLIEGYDCEVVMLERRIHGLLRDDRGYQAIQALDGVGRTLGAIFVTHGQRTRAPPPPSAPKPNRRVGLQPRRALCPVFGAPRDAPNIRPKRLAVRADLLGRRQAHT
jgi:transposase